MAEKVPAMTTPEKISAFCPVVNRPDLLENVIVACAKVGITLKVIDNSPLGIAVAGAERIHPLVPLTFSQSMNLEFDLASHEGAAFFLHMHSDAIIPDGAIERLIDFTHKTMERTEKWSVIYTHYDVLAAYNPAACRAIGGYDTILPAYFSDNDWYRRCDLAGWERINSNIPVEHGVNGQGSQTINSDPRLKFLTLVTFDIYRAYYRFKWGGVPGEESFAVPFNHRDIWPEGAKLL